VSLFRKAVENMTPYVPGEQPADGVYIKLNTNENPYPPAGAVIDALARYDARKLRLYPDPVSKDLCAAAAAAFGVRQDQVVAGNGSDEILSMIMQAFVDPGETVAYPFPTYVLYRTLAQIAGARVLEKPWEDAFKFPSQLIGCDAKLLLLCNPNSPSGSFVPTDDVRRIAKSFTGLFVVDEAYVDFARENALSLVGEFDNLMILRTVSKSFSLAGLRLGFAIADPALLSGLQRVKDSYNLSRLHHAVGLAALSDPDTMRANVKKIIATRERLISRLRDLGFDVTPTESNFVWAKPPRVPARAIYDDLRARKILVRVFTEPGMTEHLRITVGTDDEIDQLLAALHEIL